ncbi:hypothetical protein FXO37_05983 [Capsicum annuum]|nr:hypothetical protein FXO37_05983 [Capsicum annuum]
MPPPPHLFHHSSLYNSLHSSSSSVPSTSSTPSLSGLRIGGPSISTSPSINSVTTSNAIASASQILKFKEVVEYDGNGRLIITPDGNGFIAAYSDGHMVIEVIKLFYTEPLGSWNEIRFDVRILMWNQFMAKCAWNSCHENEIQCIFKLKAALRIKEHLYEAQRNLEKPGWLSADVWVQFLEKWDTPKYRAGRERAKANRASQTGGSLHTGEFQKSIEEWRQTQPTSEDGTMVQPLPADMTNMWTAMVGGPKKGRTYGTGVLQSSSSPSMFPSSYSTLQTVEEMEAMKKQIMKLTQKYAANDAKFAKFEELVKKHMPQVFHDKEDSESVDS